MQLKKYALLLPITVLTFSASVAGTGINQAWAQEAKATVKSLCKQAKVTMRQAEKIALKEVPGRVRRIELETDDDVLLYEIIICQGKTKKEVRVDAKSGKILEIDKKLGKCKTK